MLQLWWAMGSGCQEREALLLAYRWQRSSHVQGVSHDTGSGGSMPEFQDIDTITPTGRWDQGSDAEPFPNRTTLGGVARSS